MPVFVQLVIFLIVASVAGIVAVVKVAGIVGWALEFVKAQNSPPICVLVLVPIIQTLRRSPAIRQAQEGIG